MKYIDVPGEKIKEEDLSFPYAMDFCSAVNISGFSKLVSCKKVNESIEIIIFDTQVQRPQKVLHDIQYQERIAVHFYQGNTIPNVYALRNNFPKVPHINLTQEEFPRSLCIYEEPFDELKLRWTGFRFLEDIRNWLAKTSIDKLHTDDQGLEPLLLPSTNIITIPYEIFSLTSNPFLVLEISSIISQSGHETYVLDKVKKPNSKTCITFIINGEPQQHGLISAVPKNIFQLHEFLLSANIDLLTILREGLKYYEFNTTPEFSLLILIRLPKLRSKSSLAESNDLYAFFVNEKVATIKQKIGFWEIKVSDNIATRGISCDINGIDLKVELLNPFPSFTKSIANFSAGVEQCQDKAIVAVGLGSLGSHIFMNLNRMGIGNWTLVDKDILLPHNLARHTLLHNDIGFNKTERLKIKANDFLGLEQVVSIPANVLYPSSYSESINTAYLNAEIILDMAASVPVSRKLAIDVNSPAKRISAFLNPNGLDSIILCEDANRNSRLDFLEMIYYRYLIQQEELHDHLVSAKERIRVGNSCRDVSFKLPQDLVSIHSGILSRAIRNCIDSSESLIKIWKINENSLSIINYECPSSKCSIFTMGDWTIITDDYLLNKFNHLRNTKLPNETGGILIGSHDMQRKIVYVVDTIPSPPDSVEWPTVYIRGCKGLERNIKDIARITSDNLYYIGEWHSHPKGFSCKPSSDDKRAFAWLIDVMADYGYPALMLIVGETFGFYIGEMK